MAASDALVVGEDWISEHYFTTDATKESFLARVLERRKEWEALEKPADPNAAPMPTPRSRFRSERSHLEELLAALPADDADSLTGAALEAAEQLDALMREILGFSSAEYRLTERGPVTLVRPVGDEGPAPLALLRARPVTAVEDLLVKDAPTLAEAWEPVDLADVGAPALEGVEPVESVSRALSMLLTDEHGPAFVLVLAGQWALVAERERWPEGRWLAVNVQLVVERHEATRGGEVERALTCLDAHSLVPTAEGETWWTTTLEDSAAHTAAVSKDLREGVRSSIETIANEVVRRRAARGLEPLAQERAQELASQSLRYIYRIIFLLYAEASPELEILPVGTTEYDAGYGLDRLRDLALTELHEESSRAGTHIYESLNRLFHLVDEGHNEHVSTQDEAEFDGLVFRSMRADLFLPETIGLIDEVGLGNAALLQVLRRLLLTKENTRSERGFVSYAELSINQLGAVYEGLMSYSGSFAAERLWEVAPGGDASKGSWVVPEDVMKDLEEKDFVTREDEVTGEPRNVTYEKGEFVYRLSGRDRQRSASFYTPEVLTRFTVQQALAELLDQDGRVTSAEEILHLTVCEPALGSGAFAIEAVRQLAEQYLSRRERELGRRVDPEERPKELAKVKAYLALHQVYGVDLNATAVELAEVSLWLDTMVEGLLAPWFGLRLRRGNSLVGARRALYTESQLKKRAWLTAVPEAEPLSQVAAVLDDAAVSRHRMGGALDVSEKIHHFLLPAKGWGSAVEVPKQVRDLVDAEKLKALKTWRREITKAPNKTQTKRLMALARRAEVLWEMTLRRLRVAEAEASRRIDLWGREAQDDAGSTVSREDIEAYLGAPGSAYRRLRLVMDAWCALWYWPLTTQVTPPSLEEWLDSLERLLGKQVKDAKGTDGTLVDASSWAELETMEEVELGLAGARRVETVIDEHEWLTVVRNVTDTQGFFHWELDFATVFAHGGFDLQVGNPPWVRPNVEFETLLADGDPWWMLTKKPSLADRQERLPRTLARPGVLATVLDGAAETEVLAEFISDQTVYPIMEGRPDLYRAFMCQVWEHQNDQGISSLIHMETHFTDAKTPGLRAVTYRHLRRHWQFINELQLFDIDHHNAYGIHIYGSEQPPLFLHATSLYHPETVIRSLKHDGSGEEPGFKDPHTGTWDLRPHSARIGSINEEVLKTWQSVTESDDWRSTPMVSTVNSAAARTLTTLATQPRIGSLDLHFSTGWNETTDFQKGLFSKQWGAASWDDAILQGPHFHVSTPLYKQPNESMKHNLDWTSTDLEVLPANAEPITQYKPAGDRTTYDRLYTRWDDSSARDHYRIAWRAMAANTGERTLIPAIIPPGTAHPNGVFSSGSATITGRSLVAAQASLSSLLADFTLRALPKSGIYFPDFSRLPALPHNNPLTTRVVLRALRLNCVTDAYADLWAECWSDSFVTDSPILERYDERPIDPKWTAGTPLRRAEDRRNAQAEIDVMVAMMLGVPIEDLCTIYRTQFAVLYDYDHGRGQGAYVYDANGRQLPTPVRQAWEKRQHPTSNEDMPLSERTHTHPGSGVSYVYDLPFRIRDRESDLRRIHTALTNTCK